MLLLFFKKNITPNFRTQSPYRTAFLYMWMLCWKSVQYGFPVQIQSPYSTVFTCQCCYSKIRTVLPCQYQNPYGALLPVLYSKIRTMMHCRCYTPKPYSTDFICQCYVPKSVQYGFSYQSCISKSVRHLHINVKIRTVRLSSCLIKQSVR
jgi:hypothetical protein